MSKNSLKERLKQLPEGVKAAMRLPVMPVRAYIRHAPFALGKQALWDLIVSHLWWLETTVNAETVFGARLRANGKDIVGKYLYYFGIWEPNLTHWMERRLQPGDLFVDVGANIGYYSHLASKLVGESGRVVSIEALPQIFKTLEHNLKANGLRNVRPVNAAVWHREEKLKMFADAQNPSGTTTLIHEWADHWNLQGEFEVDARTLSAILTEEEIKNVRLIKIDVEGAEWNVVSEMRSWLPSCRKEAEIIIEVAPDMLKTHGKTGQDMLDIFAELGYNAYEIANEYTADAYIHHHNPINPKRLDGFPASGRDQYDIIFSRTDAPFL